MDAKVGRRYERAARAVDYYAGSDIDEPDATLVDLLTDLMHYAEHNGIDFAAACESARMHYSAERA
jgi:hypothetical protein